MSEAREVSARIEALLAEFGGDPRAEELVRCLVDFYGRGLGRVVELVGAAELAKDPLVEAMLLIHDLHPLGVEERVQRALDDVRPYLGSHAGGVEFLGIDGDGVVHLRLEGSCHGCPASTETARSAIARAVEDAAPETSGVDVQGAVPESPLLQITMRAPGPCPVPT